MYFIEVKGKKKSSRYFSEELLIVCGEVILYLKEYCGYSTINLVSWDSKTVS